jgi:hypothetical protein
MKNSNKSRIGQNPLDALLPGTAPSHAEPTPAAETSKTKSKRDDKGEPSSSPKTRATFHLPVDLFDELRDAVVACSGPPLRLTLAGFAESALRQELERLKKEHHRGKPFPKRTSELRGGRPIGS